jgi:exopolysaccharide production protein ExoQ
MPPSLALVLWIILLWGLLRFDPANDSKISLALWVPLISMFIVGSRNPSQWLDGQVGMSAQAFEEGNPLDRTISSALILLAIGILLSRSFKWGGFFARNLSLIAFVFFALVSVCWSDFPLVALKRWFRDLGNYLVILVVLSDPRPLEAVGVVLRRLSYSLVPLSILLIRYYPELGRHYSSWTGAIEYVGAATSKNMLGLVCMISGLYFFWDTVMRWPERKQRRTKRIILVNVAFIAMTLWLLDLAHSTTSGVCLILGCLVIAAAHSKVFRRNPTFLKALIPAFFCLYLILDFGFDLNGSMAGAVGKDPTLTDRTKIWAFVLGMHTNPFIGTGYQSFWLGHRLEWFWQNSGLGHLNEAHNGYLEVYLELGLIGVALLVGFLVASYRTICRMLAVKSNLAVLGLAAWLALVFYNMSEAAFQGGLLWTVFLMGSISLPERAKKRARNVGAIDNAGTAGRVPSLSEAVTSHGDNHGYSYRTS